MSGEVSVRGVVEAGPYRIFSSFYLTLSLIFSCIFLTFLYDFLNLSYIFVILSSAEAVEAVQLENKKLKAEVAELNKKREIMDKEWVEKDVTEGGVRDGRKEGRGRDKENRENKEAENRESREKKIDEKERERASEKERENARERERENKENKENKEKDRGDRDKGRSQS